MCTDWVADEPVNYLERLFVRQRLQKCSAFQVSVFIRWNKALSVRNKLTVWQWCTRCPVITFLSWLHPSCLTRTSGEAGGDLATLLNKMVFTSCTAGASFTLSWVFIAMTQTRNTPSLHVILDVAGVQWIDITTLGSQSEASRPAGLPPTRDQSTQPKELRSQNTWVTASDVHVHVCVLNHMWLVRCTQRERDCREMAGLRKTRSSREGERAIYRMPMIFLNLYRLCLKRVIFLCKIWCWDEEVILLH